MATVAVERIFTVSNLKAYFPALRLQYRSGLIACKSGSALKSRVSLSIICLWFLGVMGDTLTTFYALSVAEGFAEANPVVNHFFGLFGVELWLIFSTLITVPILITLLGERKFHLAWTFTVIWLSVFAIKAGIAAHNLYLIILHA